MFFAPDQVGVKIFDGTGHDFVEVEGVCCEIPHFESDLKLQVKPA